MQTAPPAPPSPQKEPAQLPPLKASPQKTQQAQEGATVVEDQMDVANLHARPTSPGSTVIIRRCGSSAGGNVLTHIHVHGACKELLVEGCQRLVVLLDGVSQKVVVSGSDQVCVCVCVCLCVCVPIYIYIYLCVCAYTHTHTHTHTHTPGAAVAWGRHVQADPHPQLSPHNRARS
jgi:hypothetical protein